MSDNNKSICDLSGLEFGLLGWGTSALVFRTILTLYSTSELYSSRWVAIVCSVATAWIGMLNRVEKTRQLFAQTQIPNVDIIFAKEKFKGQKDIIFVAESEAIAKAIETKYKRDFVYDDGKRNAGNRKLFHPEFLLHEKAKWIVVTDHTFQNIYYGQRSIVLYREEDKSCGNTFFIRYKDRVMPDGNTIDIRHPNDRYWLTAATLCLLTNAVALAWFGYLSAQQEIHHDKAQQIMSVSSVVFTGLSLIAFRMHETLAAVKLLADRWRSLPNPNRPWYKKLWDVCSQLSKKDIAKLLFILSSSIGFACYYYWQGHLISDKYNLGDAASTAVKWIPFTTCTITTFLSTFNSIMNFNKEREIAKIKSIYEKWHKGDFVYLTAITLALGILDAAIFGIGPIFMPDINPVLMLCGITFGIQYLVFNIMTMAYWSAVAVDEWLMEKFSKSSGTTIQSQRYQLVPLSDSIMNIFTTRKDEPQFSPTTTAPITHTLSSGNDSYGTFGFSNP